ncbi:MAG: MATE family efflux transporter [Candidatus Velthaea sp.]
MQRRAGIDDTKPIWRTMLVFLVPLMLSNILQSASGTFTSIYLGRMIGVGALAAASSIFPMLFFLISFFIGISSGSTVLIGQAFGAGDRERMDRVAGTTLWIALTLGVAVGAIGYIADEPILRLIGTPADIFADAAAYARIIFITMPVTFVFLAYTTFIRGVGDSRTPFFVLIVTTLIGIALTPLLILGKLGLSPLGVISAPIANITSTALGLIGLFVYLEVRHNPLALSKILPYTKLDVNIATTLVRIGVPTGVQFVMVSLSEIAVISFVNRFGSQATAAYGAVNQVVSYAQFPAISIGIASSIFGAQSIGARRFDRLRSIVRSGVALNYLIEGALILIAYAFSWLILGAFMRDAGTLEVAHELLVITLWSYAIFGNTSVLSGVMRSSGTVLWPTAISVFAIWAVEVPVAYALAFHTRLGLKGVWIAYPIAFVCSLTMQTAYYKFVWKRRKIQAISL